jgi:lipoprotein-anchoring transpeptidase ErfK/SrfK
VHAKHLLGGIRILSKQSTYDCARVLLGRLEEAMKTHLKHTAVAAAATAIFTLVSTNAHAQAFSWETGQWSSSAGVNTVSDRRVTAFPKKHAPGQIIVSFGDRRLYHIVRRGRAISYPIAVPRAQSRWQGVERVSYKKINPTWTPTPEMRRDNPKLPRVVAGGHPRNPLGVRAIYLGNTLYRIHGTDAPWTIGKNVSRGCIRMHNKHVVELYDKVRSGMKVTSTWKRFKVRDLDGGGSASSDLFAMLGFND